MKALSFKRCHAVLELESWGGAGGSLVKPLSFDRCAAVLEHGAEAVLEARA